MKTASRTLQLLVAALIIVVGIGAASVRVLFPNADRYRGELETWLAGVAGRPVAVGSLEAEWRGLHPEFRIKELELRNPPQLGRDGGVNAHFESATVSVNALASLIAGELRPRHISVGDVTLRIDRAVAAGSETSARQQVLPLLDWLLSQDDLRLDATRVELVGIQFAEEVLTLTNLHLVIRNEGDAHELEAAVRLPGAHDGTLSARVSVTGDPTSSAWTGDISVDIDRLDVAALEAWRYRLGRNDVAGRVSLSLDSRWRDGALVEAGGELGVQDLRIASAAGALGPLSGDALIGVSGNPGDWHVKLSHPRAGFMSFHEEPPPIVNVRYSEAPSNLEARVSATIPALDVADVLPMLPLAFEAPEDVWRQVAQAQPGGSIRDITVDIARDATGLRDIAVAGEFRGVHNTGSGGIPALTGVDGEFRHDERGTRVRLAGGRIQASLPDLFPAPLTAEALGGELLWSNDAGERRLVLSDLGFVTPDVTARATGELLWKHGDAVPFVDVSVGFTDGNLARLEHFIPTGTFGAKTGAWLDQAFPRGHLTAGSVKLRGHPPRTLAADSDFSVTVHANVHDTTVHYLDGWPSAERVAGTVHIADRRLVSNVSEGYFYDARIRSGQWVIADIAAENPVFEWTTRIDGSTEDALRFLRESPLRESFRSLVDNVDASGSASLALDLAVPLASGDPKLTGSLEIAANSLAVPSLAEGFTDVAGVIQFDQNGMHSQDLRGTYLGRPVSASIGTVEGESGHTRVRLSGRADAAYVASHLHNAGLLASPGTGSMPILTRLEGEAPFEATIDVLERTGEHQAPVALRVESSLEGAKLLLPVPFEKSAEASLPLMVEARFADASHRQMRLALGALASGSFDLRLENGGYRLHRGAVRLGEGSVTLPDDNRLSVTGRVQQADLGEWAALVLEPRDASPATNALPASVDVVIEHLSILGAEFDGVQVRAKSKPGGGWRTSINGKDLDGEVETPGERLKQPVIAKFERLVLTPAPGQSAVPADPRHLPPVRFTCRHCTYDGMQLNDVELITSKTNDGLRIDSLRLHNEGFEARANGDWTYDEERGQRTRLDVQLASDDLGKFLASLGHEGSGTRGGITDVSMTAAWNGPPTDFDLENIDGVLRFRAGEGTLTEVSRGTAGRLFGLLLIPDLPRRLTGDFSDLFEDGFAYKQIEGTFNIERGNAYTNDLTLDGSQARIDIAGRTGLVDEDYDQLITVTPKLSESLPLMPIWLVEKALQTELLNKLFAYQYTITGSWNEPSVTRVIIENDRSSGRS